MIVQRIFNGFSTPFHKIDFASWMLYLCTCQNEGTTSEGCSLCVRVDWECVCETKTYINTLWANSHASSLWWWMSLMILRERVHDVQQRHSPSCVWRHFAPQGDKQDKNRYPDGRNVGGLTALTHYIYYSVTLRMGFIGEARFIAWCVRGFYSVFV